MSDWLEDKKTEASAVEGLVEKTPAAEASTAEGLTAKTLTAEASAEEGLTAKTLTAEASAAEGLVEKTPAAEASTAEAPAEPVKNAVEEACDSLLIGYIFLWVKIQIGTLQLLPSFIGYAFLKEGIEKLEAKRQSMSLLIPLAKVLMAVSLVEWVLRFFSLANPLRSLWWIPGVVELYFQYQLLTDLAEIVAEIGTENAVKAAGKLRAIRVVYLLLRTMTLSLELPFLTWLNTLTWVYVGLIIVFILLALNLWAALAEAGIEAKGSEDRSIDVE